MHHYIWEKYGLAVSEQRCCKDRERSVESVRLNRSSGLSSDLLGLLRVLRLEVML